MKLAEDTASVMKSYPRRGIAFAICQSELVCSFEVFRVDVPSNKRDGGSRFLMRARCEDPIHRAYSQCQ